MQILTAIYVVDIGILIKYNIIHKRINEIKKRYYRKLIFTNCFLNIKTLSIKKDPIAALLSHLLFSICNNYVVL